MNAKNVRKTEYYPTINVFVQKLDTMTQVKPNAVNVILLGKLIIGHYCFYFIFFFYI